MLYVNADDLGYTASVSDRIFACYEEGRIHSASAMTFMEDSERAASVALEKEIPIGIHLNFDEALSSKRGAKNLKKHHQRVAAYLRASKWNQSLYNPLLCNSFDYVYQAQLEEFFRLYGSEPARVDGHHHMHLCMNMLFSRKYNRGLIVRRNFSFSPGEKNAANRFYRYLVDRWLMSRFLCRDFFFSIMPIENERLTNIFLLSRQADIELMVHPGADKEYEYLMGDEWERLVSTLKCD